ncbi:hypothetical protein SAY86_007615 [Trapa natans]|uniref:Uncharacterized protein n=1 Tax=Trapa natans TaxID=22666 RepID=A0AAN7R0R3_TRANT|nr:hypothetical protein SAY86_007615 [Trapa natans]
MILSLSLQVILIFCAPFKKRTSNIFMVFVVWLVYLLTDWVATFAMGLISTNYGNNSDNGAPERSRALYLASIAPGVPPCLTWKRRMADDAYKVILIELNFLYGALYTKDLVVTLYSNNYRLDKKDERIFTKMLSDYMLYLLVK